MIEFTKSYKTADGQVFASIEEAQRHELKVALNLKTSDGVTTPDTIVAIIMDKKDVIIDILTTTPNSKPKARAIHGGTKKRTPKTVITDAATSVGSTSNT